MFTLKFHSQNNKKKSTAFNKPLPTFFLPMRSCLLFCHFFLQPEPVSGNTTMYFVLISYKLSADIWLACTPLQCTSKICVLPNQRLAARLQTSLKPVCRHHFLNSICSLDVCVSYLVILAVSCCFVITVCVMVTVISDNDSLKAQTIACFGNEIFLN